MCLLEDNGVIEIGGKYQGDSRFTWTEVTDDQWYTVYLDDWRMGNVSLGLPKYDLNWNGVIVDSGTTLLVQALIVGLCVLGRLHLSCFLDCRYPDLPGHPEGPSLHVRYQPHEGRLR